MPYGPHTADDRQRMLSALGLTSVDQLFEDIPVELRAASLDLPPPEPELELAARLQWLAGRNRTDLASFLGAGVYRHWSPPAVDQILLRGEWYTAYTPYQPEVSQGTLQSIRVRVADRRTRRSRCRVGLALRRGGRDRRGGPDDVSSDAARAGPGQPRGPSALPPDPADVFRGRSRTRRDPARDRGS